MAIERKKHEIRILACSANAWCLCDLSKMCRLHDKRINLIYSMKCGTVSTIYESMTTCKNTDSISSIQWYLVQFIRSVKIIFRFRNYCLFHLQIILNRFIFTPKPYIFKICRIIFLSSNIIFQQHLETNRWIQRFALKF